MSDVLTIGEVAERSGVATSALRFYEDQGLIASERTDAGHRRYPRAVLRLVAFIVFAQKVGLSLEEIRARAGEAAAQSRARARRLGEAVGGWTKRIDERIAELERMKAASPNASDAAACRSTAASSPIPAIAPRAAAPVRATGFSLHARNGQSERVSSPGTVPYCGSEETTMPTLIWIASALAAGILARVVMKSRGFGFTGDAVLGVLGSVSGAWLLRFVGGEVSPGGVAHIATAFVGRDLPRRRWAARRYASLKARVSSAKPQWARRCRTSRRRSVACPTSRRKCSRVCYGNRACRAIHPKRSVKHSRSAIASRIAWRSSAAAGHSSDASRRSCWRGCSSTPATSRPADPYPFILLNLILSCLAAVQAPVIMMSQNRQAARDRFDAQQDYQVNVRAEMQISELHVKLDEARNVDWQAVIALQRQQLDVLERIQRSLKENEQR